MERNVLIAIILSLAVLILFQYMQSKLLTPPPQVKKASQVESKSAQITSHDQEAKPTVPLGSEPKSVDINTPLYVSKLQSTGARFTEFNLIKYRTDRKNNEAVSLVPLNFFPLEVYLASDPSTAFVPMSITGPLTINLNQRDNQTVNFIGYGKGVEITKTFTFKGDSYFIDLVVDIKNQRNEPLSDRILIRGLFSPFVQGSDYVFKGPFYYTNHLTEVKLKDTLTEYVGPLKYLGYMDVYFAVAVIILEKEADFRTTFRRVEKAEEFILWTPEFTLKPTEKVSFKFKLYFGPKKSEEMEKEHPLLAKALYFGYFDLVAKPLLWLLKFFNHFTHNYGWAIVLVTILIRILFYPLNHISFKSMKRMQELQPVIQRLKDKYKDDPQALQREIMNLYRTHRINPFSGCLPILIQIPVFFAFYKVLLMAIELRHAPFILWINDLSAPERLYLGSFEIPWLGGIPLLTILMGGTMFLQQKLTPTSMDPIQEKVMLILPIFFTFLFVNFPSGLVLYWFVNNLLSIAQQTVTLKMYKK